MSSEGVEKVMRRCRTAMEGLGIEYSPIQDAVEKYLVAVEKGPAMVVIHRAADLVRRPIHENDGDSLRLGMVAGVVGHFRDGSIVVVIDRLGVKLAMGRAVMSSCALRDVLKEKRPPPPAGGGGVSGSATMRGKMVVLKGVIHVGQDMAGSGITSPPLTLSSYKSASSSIITTTKRSPIATSTTLPTAISTNTTTTTFITSRRRSWSKALPRIAEYSLEARLTELGLKPPRDPVQAM